MTKGQKDKRTKRQKDKKTKGQKDKMSKGRKVPVCDCPMVILTSTLISTLTLILTLAFVYDVDELLREVACLHILPEILHRIVKQDLPVVDDGQVVAQEINLAHDV